MTTPLVALHITAHGEGLPTAGVCAVEGFLAGVRVGVDAQTGGPGEGLVACAADVPVVVLLVGRCAGGGEVVVVLVLVLPGGSDGGDECSGRGLRGWLLGGCGGGGVDRGGWGAGVVECCVGLGVAFHGGCI